MRITQQAIGEGWSIAIHAEAMGRPITAQLDGKYRHAIIDGLLWWTLCRKLDAFTLWFNLEYLGTMRRIDEDAEFTEDE